MKIAVIGHKGIPGASGGVERHVEEIYTRLALEGHDITVYNRKGYSNGDKLYKGLKLKEVWTIKSKNLEAIIYSFLASLKVLFGKYEVVHYHALGPSTMSFIPKLFGKKVVVTVHGLDWQRAKWGGLAKFYLKLGELVSVKFADKIIAVSRTLTGYFLKEHQRKAEYIPNGIPHAEYQAPDNIKVLGINKDDYILFLARLVPEKGCHYLIEAYKKLNTKKKLVIAGGSSHTDRYVEELKKHESTNIIFTGDVRGKCLIELLSNACFYVLPSEIEGLPITLLEAMSFGKACIVSNIPENLEVIQEEGKDIYGFSFKNKDVNNLAEKLKYLVDNQDMVERMKIKAKNHVEKEYNWNTIASQTLCVYQDILSSKIKAKNNISERNFISG